MGWESFDNVAIDHQPLTVLNSGKTVGTGRLKWLWSIATWSKDSHPIGNNILGIFFILLLFDGIMFGFIHCSFDLV